MDSRKLLLVDDEAPLREFVRALLRSAQYQVAEAGDGVEAMNMIAASQSSFDLLITDIKMPRMDGIQLARSACHLAPDMPVLFISGYASAPDLPASANVAHWDFLAKPFTPAVLLERVNALLQGFTFARKASC